ncbi:MAG: tRNA (adenosine(37)-N6)-dimethylallyltransferase MiaA [Pseudomonadota bacterium]|nr:tRNA (adenosine(37)-N6)-dimethylallyltransferase MiaA [Pseudomonadota bacterium]
MSHDQPTALCLIGPTCSGKTDISLKLVDNFNFEIVSVDSVLVYRDLNIGSAKPDYHTLNSYKHHLIDICDPSENYSCGNFYTDALNAINKIIEQGKKPLLVGGTALYFNVLQNGIHTLPKSTADTRLALERKLPNFTIEDYYAYLQEIDPLTAAKVSTTDTQRIIRAIDVYIQTGKTLSEYQQSSIRKNNVLFKNIVILPNRDILKRTIKQRLDIMVENGFLNEVQKLKDRGDLSLKNSSIRSVGYKQAWEYLDNMYDRDTFFEKTYFATCQLAKRQYTWFRKWDGERLLEKSRLETLDICLQSAAKMLK